MKRAVIGHVAMLATLAAAIPAAAMIVGGGGPVSKDCLVVFDADVNFPITNPNQVRCVDGDSTCDTDHIINGVCSMTVRVCVNSTFSSDCMLSGVSQIHVDHSFDTGNDHKFDPDLLALRQRIGQDFTFPVTSSSCTETVTFQIPIKGPLGNNHCGRTRKKIKLRSVSLPSSGALTDIDTLKLSCQPAPNNGCDPTMLFPDGTFDRIQKQIFNRSCALGGCHDSESQTGELLLETGASYGNLVNHVPKNPSAIAAGWLRVNAVGGGDAATSYLFHKVEGDLPDPTFGERMPRGKPKLNGTLREIIRLWIEGGAPMSGWVPGTY